MFGKTKARIDALASVVSQLHSRMRRESRRIDEGFRRAQGRDRELHDRIVKLEAQVELLSHIRYDSSPHTVTVDGPDGFAGFKSAIEAEALEEREEAENAIQAVTQGLASRINEIWGDGVSVDEMRRRQQEWLATRVRPATPEPTTDEEEAD